MTRWQLTCSGLALLLAACGSDDDADNGGTGGTAGARAGGGSQALGGRPQGGTAGAPRGGSSGASQGGSVMPRGGSSGAPQGGDAGLDSSAGAGASQGGAAGMPNGGSGPEGGTDAGAGGGSDAGAGGGGSEKSQFSCADLDAPPADAASRICQDFKQDTSASQWTSDGGTWMVSNGAYVATGPAEAVTCPGAGSLMTASVLNGLSASNVRVRARLTSIERADKVIVLRSRDPGNRIELNFRTTFTFGPDTFGGDLIIQELLDCQQVPYAAPTVLHEMGQAIDVVIELRGQALSVSVDGTSVVSANYPFSTVAGGVGFGVIFGGVSEFDNFVVEVLN